VTRLPTTLLTIGHDTLTTEPFATATIKPRNPIGSSQSRLNHLLRPMRTRGAMPCTWGIDPAHVVESTTSTPFVSCDRKLRTSSGEIPDGAGADSSSADRPPRSGSRQPLSASVRRWSRLGAGREWRGEKGEQGETGPTFVGHAQLLITTVEGKGTRSELNHATVGFEDPFTFHREEHEI